MTWRHVGWAEVHTRRGWQRLSDTLLDLDQRTTMPALQIQKLDHTVSLRSVCRRCNWAGNDHSIAQDHARAFGHDVVVIATEMTVYAPVQSKRTADVAS